MLLLVGLGNPGPEYAANRHNIGFMVADEIVRRHGFSSYRKRFQGLVSEGRIGGPKVLVLKPQTYMNESGRSVGAAKRFYAVPAEDVVVLHDEIDLAPGKVRVKTGGGHAGHNGLRSIQAHIGPDFRRVRIGVGHPGQKARVKGHVLKNFAKADQAWVDKLIDAMAAAADDLAAGDDANVMNRVAMALAPPKPKTEKAEKSETVEKPEKAEPAAARDREASDDGL